jgi:hypothetical protein
VINPLANTQLFVRIEGQNNDKIYSYSVVDSSITLN